MLVVVLLLMLVGFGMLVVASLTGTLTLAWVSVAASGLGAAALVVSWRQRAAAAEGERIAAATFDSPRRADQHPVTSQAVAPPPVAPPPSTVGSTPPEPSRPDPAHERADPAALALLARLDRQVLVIDEQPAYHLPGCPVLTGRTVIGLPVKEAVALDFTPCAVCTPLRVLASVEPPLENFGGRRA